MLTSLYQLLSGKTPDRIPWTADLTYWIAGQSPATIQANAWDTCAGHLRLCQELGCIPYYWYENFWAGATISEEVRLEQQTSPSGQSTKRWTTPLGVLSEVSQFVPESHSQAITRYPVQSCADLRLLLDLLERSQAVPTHLSTYPARRQAWSVFGGLPALALPRSPLPAFFTEWAGVEHGTYLLLDEPELTLAILDQLERLEAPILEAVCQLAPPLVHFADNLTSEVYTPFFSRHMAERYARRVARLHAAGVHCAVHLDGTTRGLLPRLAATGIDAIEALTPQPVGDVDAAEMRALAASERLILWGGIPGAMFAPPFTWDEMRAHVEYVLAAWRGTPFILGTADQVPPNGQISFVRRISELLNA